MLLNLTRVEHIPITPLMLADFARTKKWEINYPPHTIPTKRYDLIINQVFAILLLIGAFSIIILKWVI